METQTQPQVEIKTKVLVVEDWNRTRIDFGVVAPGSKQP